MKWKNYSVFISSTFADMHSERDYLQMYVFPEINAELKKHSISLRVIDLRCGVNTLDESIESIEEKVMRVCFDEIDRSRPFFIGLLGNRYGWTPPKGSDIFWQNRGIKVGGSITAMEIEYGFLLQKQKFGCLFMERDASCLDIMNNQTREQYDDAYSKEESVRCENPLKLNDLKKSIKKELIEAGREESYQTYIPVWNGIGFENLEDFGNKVKEAIIKDINSIFALSHNETPFFYEHAIQEEYLNIKLSKVYSRQTVIDELVDLVKSKRGLLAISGISGSGKSCVYALLVDYFNKLSDDYIVLFHSTAAGRDCREYSRMLQKWNYQLETILQLTHNETILVNDTISYFSQLIKRIPIGKKLLMFVDAIDGFNRNAVVDYLSFYPRGLSEKWLMICTSLPECLNKVSHYHRSMENYPLPPLRYDEAMAIIKGFANYHYKEPYSENLDRLMKKESDGNYCYSSPLWLIIAMSRIVYINEYDYAQIAVTNTEFNKGVIEYINRRIDCFSGQENELLQDFLLHLDKNYSGMPSFIFKLLSVSYGGLNENVISALMGDKWDSLRFATVKSFLSDFIVEQNDSKSWKIMHDKCQIQVDEIECRDFCRRLALYYIEQLQEGNFVDDNICYYLIQCKDNKLIDDYYGLFHKYRARIFKELVQVFEIMDNSLVLDFLISAFTKREGVRRFLPKAIMYWELKEIVLEIVKHFNKIGKYENTIKIVDKFYLFIEGERFNGDIKSLIFIITESFRGNAADIVLTDEERKESYLNAIKRARIKGPVSAILAPIVRKYYKWQIFKLKTK